MSPPERPEPVDFAEVLKQEAEQIAKRRKKAFPPGTTPGEPGNFVGLALSGGGIRSAMFGLGLLQALYSRGLLRYVDYLSTTSGGSYIGTFLATLAKEGCTSGSKVRMYDGRGEPNKENPLYADDGGQLHADIRAFHFGGNYLFHPYEFANRYAIGLMFLNIAFVSGLLFICAALAWLWRLPDHHWVRDNLRLADLSSDLYAAFWYVLIILAIWLLAVAAAFFFTRSDWLKAATRLLFVVLVGALCVAFAVLLGNGDISLPPIGQHFGVSETSIQETFRTPLIGLLFLALLPLFRLRDLIKSGAQPTHAWQSWVFNITVIAFLIGLPLLLVGYLAQENISRTASERDPDLLPTDVKDWSAFCGWFLDDDETCACDAGVPVEVVAAIRTSPSWRPEAAHELRQALNTMDAAEQAIKGRGTWRQWRYRSELWTRYWMLPWVGHGQDELATLYAKAKVKADGLKDKVLLPINVDLLRDRQLFELEPFRPMPTFGKDPIATQQAIASKAKPLREGPRLEELWSSAVAAGEATGTELQVKQLNRLLLEAHFPSTFQQRTTVLRSLCIENDQQTRLWWIGLSFAVFFIALLCIDVNTTSMHRFYRDRLGDRFVYRSVHRRSWFLARWWRSLKARLRNEKPGQGDPLVADYYLQDCCVDENGAPYPLIVASGRRVGRRSHGGTAQTHFFLFSPKYCGWHEDVFDSSTAQTTQVCAYCPTNEYLKGRLDIATAMAISGAAVTPFVLGNLALFALMVALNLRLGQWLPNPRHIKLKKPNHAHEAGTDQRKETCRGDHDNPVEPSQPPRRNKKTKKSRKGEKKRTASVSEVEVYQAKPGEREAPAVEEHNQPGRSTTPWVTLSDLLYEWVLHTDEQFRYCYVSDGGHHENLGLEQLLLRRCRLIIVADATADPEQKLEDLTRAVRRMRIEHGIQLTSLDDGMPLDLGDLKPDKKTGHSKRHFVLGRIIYREPKLEGLLIYLKPSLNGDEALDVVQHRRMNAVFPHDPTVNQFFADHQVEAYRQLGFHEGIELWEFLNVKGELGRNREGILSRVASHLQPRPDTNPGQIMQAIRTFAGQNPDACAEVVRILYPLTDSAKGATRLLVSIAKDTAIKIMVREEAWLQLSDERRPRMRDWILREFRAVLPEGDKILQEAEIKFAPTEEPVPAAAP